MSKAPTRKWSRFGPSPEVKLLVVLQVQRDGTQAWLKHVTAASGRLAASSFHLHHPPDSISDGHFSTWTRAAKRIIAKWHHAPVANFHPVPPDVQRKG